MRRWSRWPLEFTKNLSPFGRLNSKADVGVDDDDDGGAAEAEAEAPEVG